VVFEWKLNGAHGICYLLKNSIGHGHIRLNTPVPVAKKLI